MWLAAKVELFVVETTEMLPSPHTIVALSFPFPEELLSENEAVSVIAGDPLVEEAVIEFIAIFVLLALPPIKTSGPAPPIRVSDPPPPFKVTGMVISDASTRSLPLPPSTVMLVMFDALPVRAGLRVGENWTISRLTPPMFTHVADATPSIL